MPQSQPLQAFIEQIETVLILLGRPVVQQQLAALAVATLLAWLLSKALDWLEARYLLPWASAHSDQPRLWQRWLPALQHLYFPALTIIFSWLTTRIFIAQGFPAGLLIEAQLLFWLLALYGVLVTLLSASFGEERLHLYHRRLLYPLFILLVGGRLVDNIIDLNLLSQIEVLKLFETSITLGRLLAGFFVFYLFLFATWLMQDLLLKVFIPRTAADPGVGHSILSISRYTLIILGLFVTVSVIGFNLSTLALIGGGLSVGIGFGLQQIVANFVSGILLLFEQTLRPGDVVNIEGKIGTVEKFSIRSTLVRTNDHLNLNIPNEQLLTSVVTTYTKNQRAIHLLLPVGVSYDSEPKQLRTLLISTANEHPNVQKHPAPTVFFIGFGDSSIDFELSVWIKPARHLKRIRSDLYFMIWDTLAEHDIEIPFPQRDLNLRRGWEKVKGEE